MICIDCRKEKRRKWVYVMVVPEWSLPRLNVMAFYDNAESAMSDLYKHTEPGHGLPAAYLCKANRSVVSELKKTRDDTSFMRKLRAEIVQQSRYGTIVPGIYFL